MASNFKISELTSLGKAPGAADTLVINDNSGINPQTRSATVSDLATRILNTPIEAGRGGVLYDPIYLTWNNARHSEGFDAWRYVDQSRKTVKSFTLNQEPFLGHIMDWCPNLDTKTVKMPANANRALLLWQYEVGVSIDVSTASTKDWWNAGWNVYFPFTSELLHLLTFGNAELRGNPNMNRAPNTLGSMCSPNFTCHGSTQAAFTRGDSSSNSKIDILSFDAGASISVDLRIDMWYANHVVVGTTPVRLILIPYYDDGSGLPIASIASGDQGLFYVESSTPGVMASNEEIIDAVYNWKYGINIGNGDVPPVNTTDDTKLMEGNELREQIIYVLSAIASYDPTSANSTLTGYRNELLALKGSNDDFATLSANVTRIRGLAAIEIGFTFGWETLPYSL